MPNTSPAVDNASVVAWILEKARSEACVNVFPTGAITKAIAGEELAPIGALKRAGVVAITDDGHCVQNHELMRRALEYAGMFDLVVMDHCQDYNLVGKGVMHEGTVSTVLGLPGWPAVGEEIIVARNAQLAELTGTAVHCQHLSAAGSVRILREARARGIPLSGEVCPHHIALTDDSLRGYDTNFKMNPAASLAGARGRVDRRNCRWDDHRAVERSRAALQLRKGSGVSTRRRSVSSGLETELGLFLDILIHKRAAISLSRLIELYT
jgi:dihydroorotase